MRFGCRLYEHNTGDLSRLVECYDDVPEAEPTMEELVAQNERLAELVAEHEGE